MQPSLVSSNFLRSVSMADCNLAFSSFAADDKVNQPNQQHYIVIITQSLNFMHILFVNCSDDIHNS